VRALFLLLSVVAVARAADASAAAKAADPAAVPESSIAKQRASIQKQKDAIRAQAAASLKGESNSFFTAPWISPMQIPTLAPASFDCDPLPEPQVSALIAAAATAEEVKPELIRAVMRQESGFHACAVSPRGAQGLMQLMPATAERFHVTDPFDPAQNVNAGAKFLKELLGKYAGDLRLALGAYNAGPANVDAAGTVPDNAETRGYVSNILQDLGVSDSAPAAPASSEKSGTT